MLQKENWRMIIQEHRNGDGLIDQTHASHSDLVFFSLFSPPSPLSPDLTQSPHSDAYPTGGGRGGRLIAAARLAAKALAGVPEIRRRRGGKADSQSPIEFVAPPVQERGIHFRGVIWHIEIPPNSRNQLRPPRCSCSPSYHENWPP